MISFSCGIKPNFSIELILQISLEGSRLLLELEIMTILYQILHHSVVPRLAYSIHLCFCLCQINPIIF